MRMNTNIAMRGAQPDFVNALSRGFSAGREARQADLYQQHGAGIAAGDQASMNALAQFDPRQALDVQGAQQSMAAQRQRMEALSAQERRAIQAHAANMSEAQRASEMASVTEGLKRGIALYQAGDLNGINALLTQVGEQPIQSLEQFPAIAVRYKGVLEAMQDVKAFSGGPKPSSPQGKLLADLQAGLITPEQFEAANQKTGMRVASDGQGGFTIEQGPGVTTSAPKLTVDAAKNTGFMIRMRESNDVLNRLEEEGTNFTQQNLEAVPLGIGNYFRTEDFQKFDQARRDFVNAILRRESGAVISDQEFDNANKQYFPMPGDGPEVIAQKRRNRETAIRGIEIGSGDGAAFVDQQDAQATSASPFAGMSKEELGQVDFSNMSLEEINAWNARMDELGVGQ